MTKKILITLFIIMLFPFMGYFFWRLTQDINYDRRYYNQTISDYIPKDSKMLAYIDRKFFYDVFANSIDKTDSDIWHSIAQKSHYPLVITKCFKGKNMLLQKVNKKELNEIESFITKNLSFNYSSITKNVLGHEVNFHPLENDEFLITCCRNGVLAISTDINCIESFLSTDTSTNLTNQLDIIPEEYKMIPSNKKQSFIYLNNDSIEYFMTVEYIKEQIHFKGQKETKKTYIVRDTISIPQLKYDSIKLSINEGKEEIELWIN